MNTNEVNALKQLGSEWQKNEMHRVYFNDLADWYGLHVEYYNTGNVSSARDRDGEKISNSHARELLAALSGKLYYDVATGHFHGKGISQYYFDIVVANIKTRAAELVAEMDAEAAHV